MKKIVLSLVGVVAVAVAGFVGAVMLQPAAIEVSASTSIAAGASDVEPFLRDLRKMNEWSPWIGIDPDLKMEYAPATQGVGAWYTWEGNDEVGKGKQTVLTDEAAKVVHDLHFIKPFEGHAQSTLTWSGDASSTKVTWSFHQEADFGTKAANLFMDIEGMLLGDFQKGMDQLGPVVMKGVHEREAQEEVARQAAELARQAAEQAAAAAVVESSGGLAER